MVTFTSSVPSSLCVQAAPGISFIFKEMILKVILYLLEEGDHCFGAAQPSTRTWEGAHVALPISIRVAREEILYRGFKALLLA